MPNKLHLFVAVLSHYFQPNKLLIILYLHQFLQICTVNPYLLSTKLYMTVFSAISSKNTLKSNIYETSLFTGINSINNLKEMSPSNRSSIIWASNWQDFLEKTRDRLEVVVVNVLSDTVLVNFLNFSFLGKCHTFLLRNRTGWGPTFSWLFDASERLVEEGVNFGKGKLRSSGCVHFDD